MPALAAVVQDTVTPRYSTLFLKMSIFNCTVESGQTDIRAQDFLLHIQMKSGPRSSKLILWSQR